MLEIFDLVLYVYGSTVFCLTRLGRRQNGDFSKAICARPGVDCCSNQEIFGNQKKHESQALPLTHPWLWHAVCEARPTEGDGPDAGGSAFFDRTKNDGMLQKKHPYLSKTAQSPQVVGAAGKTAFFFGTFFWASKRKYRC
jgi:hypothetical protein